MHQAHGKPCPGSRDEQPCLLDKDLSEPRLAKGVVLEVEAVEAVEGVLIRMHVQRVHIQVIPASMTCPYQELD